MTAIEIDGQQLEVNDGEMIIEAADRAGIPIPRFCYHKKLSIAANCRMCLVDVEKSGKPLPACATPVAEGMKVQTRSQKALAAQKSVMEFLLLNHPLDCPVCDQGGQCELQDVAMGYGRGVSRYTEGKRAVDDEDLGSLIATEMTRCIHCTRCVRFGEEIAGMPELGVTGRGEDSRIGTYLQGAMTSELSGNVIDVCPVGALTSKPFRFRARAWELHAHPTIAAHDCVGSHVQAHVLRGRVMRVVPDEADDLNEVWLSDRDRFSYEGLNHADRLTAPMIRRNGTLHACTWEEALEAVQAGLKRVASQHGAGQIGGLISPSATLEEQFLFQKWMRGMGSTHVDHRIRRSDFRGDLHASQSLRCELTLPELQAQKTIVLLGSHVRHEQPMVAHRVRQAALQGASVLALDLMQHAYHFDLAAQHVTTPADLVWTLAGVVKAVSDKRAQPVPKDLQAICEKALPVSDAWIEALLHHSDATAILLGAAALNHPDASIIDRMVEVLQSLLDARVMMLTEGANARGAHLAGCLPHRGPAGASVSEGRNAHTMFAEPMPAYCLMGIEPELDCNHPATVVSALKEADFVVALHAFRGGILEAHADVLLPSAPFTETPGTFINAMGDWQSFQAVVPLLAETKPGWKILRALGHIMGLEGFEPETWVEWQETLEDALQSEMHQDTESTSHTWEPTLNAGQFVRLSTWPMVRVDGITRRAEGLQKAAFSEPMAAHLNAEEAARLQLSDGDKVRIEQAGKTIEVPWVCDARVPNQTVYLPAGFCAWARLGDMMAPVSVSSGGASE